jgi:murein DD-endopeptidase MepM/ murein hydrolase activator NlpD
VRRSRWGAAGLWLATVLALTLVAVVAPVAVPPALANPQAELQKVQQELERLKNQRSAVDNAYARAESEARQAQLMLQKVQAELALAQNALAEIQARLKATEEALQKVETELAAAEKEYQRRQQLFYRRLRALSEEGPVRYLDVLFGSANFTDFISRLGMLRIIVTKDAELFRDIRTQKAILEERRAVVSGRRTQLANLRLEAQVRAADVQLKLNQTRQQTMELEALRRSLIARMSEMDREEEKLQGQVAELQRQIARQAGKFAPIWPMRRVELTDTYGMRWHPIVGGYRAHNGIDLAANTGEHVLAVEEGWVLLAGWNGAFGNLVVLDHGGGISTWYAHNSRLLVSVGQQVKAGTVIAHAGSTGWSTGPHLHFEIRKDGKPVNPLDYLPRR